MGVDGDDGDKEGRRRQDACAPVRGKFAGGEEGKKDRVSWNKLILEDLALGPYCCSNV